jgi:hypothetical protein
MSLSDSNACKTKSLKKITKFDLSLSVPTKFLVYSKSSPTVFKYVTFKGISFSIGSSQISL